MSLSDGSEQFDIEIEERDYSLLHSEPDDQSTATMSANREDVEEPAETPTEEPAAVPLPRLPEVFTPVHGRRPDVHRLTGNIRRFDIGRLIKKFPIPPPLLVPIYGTMPSPGSPTLDGLYPIYYGEDSRVGLYAYYGEFSLPLFLHIFVCCNFVVSLLNFSVFQGLLSSVGL